MKTFLSILFISFSLLIYSQNKNNVSSVKYKKININTISVVDTNFYRLLDLLFQFESKCSYYFDTLPYELFISKWPTEKGDSVIVLSFIGNSEKEFAYKNGEYLLGCLSYKGHDFFIKGRLILNSIIITNKIKTYKFRENLSPDEDDRWSIYRFLYFNKNFVFYKKENDWLCK